MKIFPLLSIARRVACLGRKVAHWARPGLEKPPCNTRCYDEAIGLLESRPETRVLFSDIQMPCALDGVALGRLAREWMPDLIIVLTSGQRIPAALELPNAATFSSKTYDANHLAGLLRGLAA